MFTVLGHKTLLTAGSHPGVEAQHLRLTGSLSSRITSGFNASSAVIMFMFIEAVESSAYEAVRAGVYTC